MEERGSPEPDRTGRRGGAEAGATVGVGAGDDVEQRALAGLVPLGPRQAALVGPAAVAVHDDRDVPGDQVGGHRRRRRSARVGEGGLVAAHPVLCDGVGWLVVRST